MSIWNKKALRLVTALVLVGVALGAQQVSAASRRAPAVAPTGVIAITDWEFPDGCGPAGGTVVDQEVCVAMLEGGTSPQSLFTIDNHANYVPDMAVSIPTLKNGGAKIVNGNLVVTYKLKPNLKWSDGSPLTTSDLVFGTKLEMAIGNTFGIDQITAMKVIDARTLQVTYKGTYVPYYEYGSPYVLPQKYLEKKYGTTSISAMASKFGNDLYNSPSDVWDGPYMLKSWTNSESVIAVPNPYYNALPPAKGQPRLAEFKFVNVSNDESGLAAALGSRSAGVDKAEDFQYTDLPVLKSTKYHINVQPSLEYEHLELNLSGPLKDVRLRQALNYAIDKRAYFHAMFPAIAPSDIDKYLLGGPVPNISPWADKSLPLNQYDPAKARALIRAAGYSDQYYGTGKHLTLRFYTTAAPIREKSVGILSRMWATVGVHVIANFVKASGNNGLFSPYNLNGILVQRRFDIAEFAYEVPPDPQSAEESFDPSLIPTAARHGNVDENYQGNTDQQQWSLLQKARYALDSGQRHALFNQWQKLVMQRAYWIMLFNRANITADNGTIGNYKPNPSSQGNEWNIYQWYRVGAS